jgi:hypothetical protein
MALHPDDQASLLELQIRSHADFWHLAGQAPVTFTSTRLGTS